MAVSFDTSTHQRKSFGPWWGNRGPEAGRSVLRFFLEYQWFVDFAVYSGGVYFFTEAYYYVLCPAKETNIAVFWCLLTVAFSIKVFLTVTRLYFSAEEGGERSVCLTFAFLFLLLAMLVQVVREETLELGLEPGLASMTQNLEPLLKMQGWDWAPSGQTGHPCGASGRGLHAGCLPHLPRPAAGPDPPGCPDHVRRPAHAAVPPAHQLPVPSVCPVALDQAHCTGLPAPGTFWGYTLLPVVRRGLRLAAPLGAGGSVSAAAGGDPAPPAGLPVPGQGPCGAAAAGGRPHRGPRDPAASGAGLLLRDSGESAVPDAAHPHAQLHAAAQDAGWLLLGPGPGHPAVSRPIHGQRWPGRPLGGRGPADCGPDRRGPEQPAHAPLPPRRPRLPHLVDRRLPAALQSLRPLLPPAPGGLLAAYGTRAPPPLVPQCPQVQGRPGSPRCARPFTTVPEPWLPWTLSFGLETVLGRVAEGPTAIVPRVPGGRVPSLTTEGGAIF
ncbi:transmembrane protein 161A isoform X2 [Diceros bicornis minor]|uniref:transmembrane protein 161A isoform X2 n=1 Tax=Diceros bicornis minor TaxID=77932 RepID=UPI0026EC3305|nr:transmembrane protein 161A isoform X2 [Diceros bicornis minor]